ncbi:type VI secretion system tube protein Hcp [Luteibacter sp.]|jgi:type VI secretion system secreted protein Hcp|uniref:Hcp family type VI secretion system effector n=1 Tax=Luteibacter sp. TaxID=1886636 RepID=UPI002F3FECFF
MVLLLVDGAVSATAQHGSGNACAVEGVAKTMRGQDAAPSLARYVNRRLWMNASDTEDRLSIFLNPMSSKAVLKSFARDHCVRFALTTSSRTLMKSIYLKLTGPDIKGESTDKDHAGWIELSSWQHQLFQRTSPVASTSGGHAVERTEHGALTLVKEMDSASPLLFQALSGGTTFQSAQIDIYRAAGNGKRIKYLEIQLKKALISQIGVGGGDTLANELIALRYAAIQWKYQKQNIDGGVAGITQGAWSLTKNDKTFVV